MLVLSRRLNQKILLPSINASVEVVAIKGNVVRLGVIAPPNVTVLREELADGPAAVLSMKAASQSTRSVDLKTACAELAALRERFRGVLPPEEAAILQRVEMDLREILKGRSSAAPKRPARDGRRRPTALLVEDNANERELLAQFLRMAGVRVDTAGDGADALGYLNTHNRPDVILLDMGMPRCDGPTAVRAIRQDPAYAGVKIVAVTGHLPGEYDLPVGPEGVDRWVHKPVDPVALVRELERDMEKEAAL
jgi:carbon storage regulator CsrA